MIVIYIFLKKERFYKMTKHRVLLLFLSLAAFSLGLASYMTAGLIPLIAEDFSVSIGVSAHLVSAFTLPYGLISPLLVGLTDRFDPKKKSMRLSVNFYCFQWCRYFGTRIYRSHPI